MSFGFTAVTWVAIAATAISAAGSAYAAVSASEAADETAKLQEEQAKQEQVAAQSEADLIRKKGRRVAGTQAAALAASGVRLDGQGSGSALLTETKTLAEQDALAAITGGANRATLLNDEAKISKDKATSTLIAGGMNTASTLLGGASAYQRSKQPAAQALNVPKDQITTSRPKLTLLG